jgi:hypothetical protein
MGIVNPPEVQPGLMRAIYRLSLRFGPGGQRLDGYKALLLPPAGMPSVGNPERTVDLNLTEAQRIGLLVEGKRGRLRCSIPAPPDGIDPERFFAARLRALLFEERNNPGLFAGGSEEDGVQPDDGGALSTVLACEFTRIQTWLNMSSKMGQALRWGGDVRERSVQVLGENAPGGGFVRNDARWTGFRPWAVYLGLARRTEKGVDLVVDPSRAALEELASHPAGEVAAADLTAWLAARIPVLDGGAYWRQMLAFLGEDEVEGLSAAFELALLRAQADGMVEFQSRSDFGGPSLRLDGRNFTHAVVVKRDA